MYELNYVKKRKRNKWIAIGAASSVIVISTFSLIAFLGRFVGTFTVSLNTENVKLTLSDSHDFRTQSSYLRIGDLPSYHETTYTNLPSDEVIDTDETDYLIGANYKADGVTIANLQFFKYTFYVKNIGTVPAAYQLAIKVLENRLSDDGRSLLDTLRVMVYENDQASLTRNEPKIYAKASPNHHIDESGQISFDEAITVTPDRADELNPFLGYAEQFESDSIIKTISVRNFDIDQIKRYTIVYWLEGNDLQSEYFKKAPVGANLRIGVEINAYEN